MLGCKPGIYPCSIWPQVKDLMNSFIDSAKMGDPADFSVFMGAVIDQKAFKNIASYIDYAKARPEEYTIVKGGTYDDSTGYFIHPTIIETTNPRGRLMEEEIFGLFCPCTFTTTPKSKKPCGLSIPQAPSASPAPSSPTTAATSK